MWSKNIQTTAEEKRTIIVNGYAESDITREEMARWAGDLTYVSCYSYGFSMEGDLVPLDDEGMIQIANDSGVAPLMVLTPYDENGQYSYELVKKIFTNPVVRDRLINNVVLTVLGKKYYGCVFNFGYIAVGDRDQFVITVAKTAARLNRIGALLIVSLLPGVNDAGIDYESLGRAANLLELRAFYWEKAVEPPYAVSPISSMKDMLSFVTASVNPRNILLGLSNYGFDWTLPFIQGGMSAEMISHAEALERAARMNAEIQYEVTAEAPYYSYTNPTGSRHEVWFEDARSFSVKLNLVNEFDLAGISIWTIMNPFPAGIAGIREQFTALKV